MSEPTQKVTAEDKAAQQKPGNKMMSASEALAKPVFQEDLIMIKRNIADLQHEVRKLFVRTD